MSPQESGEIVKVNVGLNYACMRSDDGPQNDNFTLCELLPFFYKGSCGRAILIFAVRSLMTLNAFFMIICFTLSVFSLTCQDREYHKKRKIITRFINILCCIFGTCGLIMFATTSCRYSSPFDVLYTPEIVKQLGPASPYISFFLSCLGCSLYTSVTFVETILCLWERKRRGPFTWSETRQLRSDDKVSYIRNRNRLLDPVSASTNINSEWTHVETCHVEIFRDLYVQH